MSYYSEEIKAKSKYRQDYVDGIEQFLDSERINAEATRNEYITPEKYKENPERYRNALIEQLGFPLDLKRETPVLKEKRFVVKDGNVNVYRMQFTFFGRLCF